MAFTHLEMSECLCCVNIKNIKIFPGLGKTLSDHGDFLSPTYPAGIINSFQISRTEHPTLDFIAIYLLLLAHVIAYELHSGFSELILRFPLRKNKAVSELSIGILRRTEASGVFSNLLHSKVVYADCGYGELS